MDELEKLRKENKKLKEDLRGFNLTLNFILLMFVVTTIYSVWTNFNPVSDSGFGFDITQAEKIAETFGEGLVTQMKMESLKLFLTIEKCHFLSGKAEEVASFLRSLV